MGEPLTFNGLKSAFAAQDLFEDKSWQLSPQPWPVSEAELKQLQAIGDACLEFYRATELLYNRASDGKSLVRNRQLLAPWVSDYYDRGKPSAIVRHARHKAVRRKVPTVIRPDLLVTGDGFAMTEVDSVPGGIGLTAYLNRLYAGQGTVIGADDAMVTAFHAALAALRPDVDDPLIAIVVSDEANTYRPEMEWIAAECRARGGRVYQVHPGDLFPIGDSICADIDGSPTEVDVIYRFWELFDMPNIPITAEIMRVLEAGAPLAVTPPMRAFQEEKLSLALFHHPRLQGFWREALSKSAQRILKGLIPEGWVVDAQNVPPNAFLHAPSVGGQPITDWLELAEASQKERDLILKLSGFNENAWGARSVLYGRDASRDEWLDGLREAVTGARSGLHILQAYRKPARRTHPVYAADGQLRTLEGRVRLCPYYFVNGEQTSLCGVLATICPADKKIIHGMRDAAMVPAMRS